MKYLLFIAITLICLQNTLECKLYDSQKARTEEKQKELRRHYLEDCKPFQEIDENDKDNAEEEKALDDAVN